MLAETLEREVDAVKELLATDRCDRCNAQAYHRATRGEGELLFCNHHANEYGPALIAQGFILEDQSDRLYADTPMSANV